MPQMSSDRRLLFPFGEIHYCTKYDVGFIIDCQILSSVNYTIHVDSDRCVVVYLKIVETMIMDDKAYS